MVRARIVRIGGNGVHIPTDLALILKNSIMVSPNLDLNLKSLAQGNLYMVNRRYMGDYEDLPIHHCQNCHFTADMHTDTSIQVKRKYKMAESGKVAKWWNVVSGDEGTIAKLEEEWWKVQI